MAYKNAYKLMQGNILLGFASSNDTLARQDFQGGVTLYVTERDGSNAGPIMDMDDSSHQVIWGGAGAALTVELVKGEGITTKLDCVFVNPVHDDDESVDVKSTT